MRRLIWATMSSSSRPPARSPTNKGIQLSSPARGAAAPGAHDRAAILVEGLHLRAQGARLQLALVDGQQRAAADERRAHVGAAAGGEQPRVLADVVIDPLEALG